MKYIKVTNWKGKTISGDWNEKFYEPQVEGNSDGIHRIYIDNERVHITEEEKERLLQEAYNSKAEQDNMRIRIIKSEFSKLDSKSKELLIEYLKNEMS